MDNKRSYRDILKSTSIFGGTQVLTIIISIIKSKLVAVLIGPAGLGINGLYISTTGFISSIFSFGIERSAVKNIANHDSSGNIEALSKTIFTVRILLLITGVLGGSFVFLFAPFLSQITFASENYVYGFYILSITLLFDQFRLGYRAILRGTRKIHILSKESIFSALSGLFVSVPLYYYYGLDGILPSIVISSFVGLVTLILLTRKIRFEKIIFSLKTFSEEAKNILKLGALINFGSLSVIGVEHIIRLYIGNVGSVKEVGFYNAAFAILNTYFGLFFTALTMDYYPKLAGMINKKKESILLMNQQSEMSSLLILPLLILF